VITAALRRCVPDRPHGAGLRDGRGEAGREKDGLRAAARDDRLLAGLRDRGVITAEEFERAKAKILA